MLFLEVVRWRCEGGMGSDEVRLEDVRLCLLRLRLLLL